MGYIQDFLRDFVLLGDFPTVSFCEKIFLSAFISIFLFERLSFFFESPSFFYLDVIANKNDL